MKIYIHKFIKSQKEPPLYVRETAFFYLRFLQILPFEKQHNRNRQYDADDNFN